MSKSDSARRLIAVFIVVAISTTVSGKDSKELPIKGGRIVMYVPGQNKLFMEGGRTSKPERGIYGFAIINAVDGKVLGVLQEETREMPQPPLFSPDGASFVTVTGVGKMKLWQTSTVKIRKELDVLKKPSGVAFSSDGKMLAVVGHLDDFGAPMALRAVDIPSGKERWTVRLPKNTGNRSAQVAASKNDKLLVGQDGVWQVVEFQTGSVEKMYDGETSLEDLREGSLHLCHDSKRFVHANREFVSVWDIEARKKVYTLTDKRGEIKSKFLPGDDRNSDVIAVGTGDGLLRLLNINTLKLVEFGDRHEAAITAVDASESKRIAVTASLDHRIKVWNLETSQLAETLIEDRSSVMSVAISSDGKRIAGRYENDSIRIWNLK